jgi:hypothetical protein
LRIFNGIQKFTLPHSHAIAPEIQAFSPVFAPRNGTGFASLSHEHGDLHAGTPKVIQDGIRSLRRGRRNRPGRRIHSQRYLASQHRRATIMNRQNAAFRRVKWKFKPQ